MRFHEVTDVLPVGRFLMNVLKNETVDSELSPRCEEIKTCSSPEELCHQNLGRSSTEHEMRCLRLPEYPVPFQETAETHPIHL